MNIPAVEAVRAAQLCLLHCLQRVVMMMAVLLQTLVQDL